MDTLRKMISMSLLACAPAWLGCAEDEDEGSMSETGGGGSPAMAGSGGAPVMAGSGSTPPEAMDIVDTALAAGDFEMLAGALTKAGLVDALKGDGPFTVFAPTDEAFAAFEAENPGVLGSLDVAQLTGILTYHVIAGAAVESTELVDGGAAATLNGAPILFDLSAGAVIQAGEGTSAAVTAADVTASNGVIHVIDAIILPPSKDIVATAVEAGSFETLAAALASQGLVETLQGEGPFTVFAPTDDAFAMLGAAPSGDALTDVLLYHVADGLVGSGNLADGMVAMKSGDSVTVSLADGVRIDESSVTAADILASNGIIHVVDAVLVP